MLLDVPLAPNEYISNVGCPNSQKIGACLTADTLYGERKVSGGAAFMLVLGQGQGGIHPPRSWVYNYPTSRLASVLQLPDSQSSILSGRYPLTQADNVGHVYRADQQNYSALPCCWSAEDAGVTAECGG